jgi:HD-like signal output (HDOD) protein
VSTGTSDYAIYRQVVSQLMSGEEQLPSLPAITLEIRRALSDPEVSLAQLNRQISRDPALSAILMKYASSALRRTQLPPKSLLDVLRILGIAQIDRITMFIASKACLPCTVLRIKNCF